MKLEAACRLLGIDSASAALDEDAKHAYRRLSLTAHPDKGGSTEDFQDLAEAYETVASRHENEHDMATNEEDWEDAFFFFCSFDDIMSEIKEARRRFRKQQAEVMPAVEHWLLLRVYQRGSNLAFAQDSEAARLAKAQKKMEEDAERKQAALEGRIAANAHLTAAMAANNYDVLWRALEACADQAAPVLVRQARALRDSLKRTHKKAIKENKEQANTKPKTLAKKQRQKEAKAAQAALTDATADNADASALLADALAAATLANRAG